VNKLTVDFRAQALACVKEERPYHTAVRSLSALVVSLVKDQDPDALPCSIEGLQLVAGVVEHLNTQDFDAEAYLAFLSKLIPMFYVSCLRVYGYRVFLTVLLPSVEESEAARR